MFLQPMIDRNPGFLEACVKLHQLGEIPSNSYVLDLDTIQANAEHIKTQADQYGLTVFSMSKQIGRNPAALHTLKSAGLDSCVCVDMSDARAVHKAGLKIGHIGHLVQVPKHEVRAAIEMKPQYWTIFSLEKARELSDALKDAESQKVLLRVFCEDDSFYWGHEGGFHTAHIDRTIEEINSMPGLEFAGICSFPTQLYNQKTGMVEYTNNFRTLLDTARRIEEKLGRKIQINAPGTTSSLLFADMAKHGVTQVEPGHGLTGTCPQHAKQDLTEKPAMAYVSEVSHRHNGKDYCFGGGMYIDPVFGPYQVKACVGRTPDQALNQQMICEMPKPESIDYYGILQTQQHHDVRSGDTVVFGFRAQAFVTRAYVTAISGVRTGDLQVRGIYDVSANWADWQSL